MQLPQDRDKSFVVDQHFFRVKRSIGPDLFQNIIKPSQCDAVLGLHAFAMCVQFFGKLSYLHLRGFPTDWKGERIKAAGFDINGVVAVADPTTSGKGVNEVNLTA